MIKFTKLSNRLYLHTLSYFQVKPFSSTMAEKKLDKFGRPFPDYEKHPAPVLTVDNVVIRETNKPGDYEILMCTRGITPFKGCFVLPGGHVDYNEDPETACIRELKEETNLDATSVELLCVKGDPQRDPRKHVVTIAYLVKVQKDQIPKGGDDAADAKFYPLKEILGQKDKIGFDHASIIEEAIKKLKISL